MGPYVLVKSTIESFLFKQVMHVQVSLAEDSCFTFPLLHRFESLRKNIMQCLLILDENHNRNFLLKYFVVSLFVWTACKSIYQIKEKAVEVETSWILDVVYNG